MALWIVVLLLPQPSLERVGFGASTADIGSKDLIATSSPIPLVFSVRTESLKCIDNVTIVSIKLKKIKLDNLLGH